MTFNFKRREQNDYERILDAVYASMETGNAGNARLVLAEHAETFPTEVELVRKSVLKDYGISL